MKIIFLLLITLNIFAQEDKFQDPVVAEIGKNKIRKSTLLKYHQQNLSYVRANKKVTIDSSLNDLINRVIGITKGKKNKIHKRPSVIKKMNDIIYHAQISEDLSPKFKKIGEIQDSETIAYCKKNPEYRTSQILHRLRTQPSKKEVSESFAKFLSIYNDLVKKPNNFSKLAKSFSQTGNSSIGGDLGFQPKSRLSPEFYQAIKGKKIGFVTKPFRTQYGIHIVKVTGIKNCKDIDKNIYKKILYDIKRDQIIDDYFLKLRKKAKIKIYKDKI